MGYVFCMGNCVHCGGLFSFNPDLVPSVVINGTRQPVCRKCVLWANERRAAKGLKLFDVLPGAYEAQEVG